MLKFFRSLFFGRDLADILAETRIVKVHGIRFHIKKLDPVAFLDGSKVLLQHYDTYKIKSPADVPEVTKGALEKVMSHYTDVFCSSVVHPRIVRKPEQAVGGAIFADHLFTEWDLANELYGRIVEFTYGKKKFQPNIYPVSAS